MERGVPMHLKYLLFAVKNGVRTHATEGHHFVFPFKGEPVAVGNTTFPDAFFSLHLLELQGRVSRVLLNKRSFIDPGFHILGQTAASLVTLWLCASVANHVT